VFSSKYRLPWRVGTSPSLSIRLTEGCGFDCCGGNCQPRDLKVIEEEIAALEAWPRTDAITLVGGEPTRHPELAEIVKAAREVCGKVVLCTNGYDLGPERLCELRDVGLWGVNLRINPSQSRPGWRDSSEIQIEGLRTHYAEMVARVGGLLCGFEIEVSEGDFRQLADVLAWAERNIDRVQRLVLHYSSSGSGQAPGARPDDMAENWASAGWMASSDLSIPAGLVTWRVGRRGSDILAASPRLLRMLCEYYESTHRRHFAFLNPQSFRSQLTCWIGALSDMSLRPLAKEIIASLKSPSKVISPRLASQFLFSLDGESKSAQATTCTGAGWDSLGMPAASALLGSIADARPTAV
jgi:hypothetical protein